MLDACDKNLQVLSYVKVSAMKTGQDWFRIEFSTNEV
jgi:hypothetical protein